MVSVAMTNQQMSSLSAEEVRKTEEARIAEEKACTSKELKELEILVAGKKSLLAKLEADEARIAKERADELEMKNILHKLPRGTVHIPNHWNESC